MADESAQVAAELGEVRAALEREGAPWVAGATSVSQLPQQERLLRLGAVPGPGQGTLQEIAQRAVARRAALMAEATARTITAPAAYDLRNVGGRNFVTPIKDQGGCGSCVAFGTVAAIECTFRVQRNDANLATNLSEAHLFYCHGRAQGRTCGTGWIPDQALETCKNPGIADEACYPYTAGDQNCSNLCADWQNRVTKITAYHAITPLADMKTWVSTRGALTACFVVYNDFFSYQSGVYRHVSGGQAGGHCVSIIGYDDSQGCWICKNSWGPGWGDQGFFRIAYGECGIDTWQVCAVDGIVETGWLNNQTIVGLWTIDQDRNAYAYLSGAGWRRVAFDNDNIFLDMLTQLAAAKAGNRPCNVYQEAGVIRQIYVL